MNAIGIGAILLATVVVAFDVVTTRALWSSPLFERDQKVVQTILVWLIPGAFIAIRHLIHEPHHGRDGRDPTVANDPWSLDVDDLPHDHGGGDGHG